MQHFEKSLHLGGGGTGQEWGSGGEQSDSIDETKNSADLTPPGHNINDSAFVYQYWN